MTGGHDETRWDLLSTDLEADLDAHEVGERRLASAEIARAELAGLHLADRLRAGVGRPLVVTVLGLGRIEGRASGLGPDWLRMDLTVPPRTLVLRLDAVLVVTGLGTTAAGAAAGAVSARLGIGSVLRDLARGRLGVQVHLLDGARLSGTVDMVGADHLELAEHADGEPRRRAAVRDQLVVPLSGVAGVSWERR